MNKFCTKCGAALDSEAVFCGKCGTRVSTETNNVEAEKKEEPIIEDVRNKLYSFDDTQRKE